MSNILVSTMGTSWQVIPELVGFTNPEFDYYRHHRERHLINQLRREFITAPIDQVFVITTGGSQTEQAIRQLENWSSTIALAVKLFRLETVNELATVEECQLMADHIYRVVLQAAEESNKLYLSLAGGRKTMSAEIQQAGNFFGCEAMLHVVDKNMSPEQRNEFARCDFRHPPPAHLINNIMPLISCGKVGASPLLAVKPAITSAAYPVLQNTDSTPLLYNELQRRQKRSTHLLLNYLRELTDSRQNNFRELYSLPPAQIERLQRSEVDYEFVKLLPKAELHCHFGGILSPSDMLQIAQVNLTEIKQYRVINEGFDNFMTQAATAVKNNDLATLRQLVPDVKKLRRQFVGIPEPYGVAGFISCLGGNAALLENFIYGKVKQNFSGIGIAEYEKLGDLQGSGLMQNESSIRFACRILADKCRRHNVTYIEVRCSPVNYTRGGLTAERVVEIMMDEFRQAPETFFNLIFIASRHGRMSDIFQHIELAEQLLQDSPEFENFFAGFDLAGAEDARAPRELRDAFLPLMQKCIHLTIHAGETVDIQSIWEAVYYLNADRIGHGLALQEDKNNLLQKFVERRIFIEMCPSSNEQIVGFKPNSYPLKRYLKQGLKVTVNTDNPGISRTDFSREYIKAAELCGGLSRWDILLLIKNAFRGSFCEFEKRRELLLEAERKIMTILDCSA